MVFQVTFPNGNDLPTGPAQIACLLSVSSNVAAKLFLPKCGVVLWQRETASRAAMPKTSVNEYGYSSGNESYVGPAGDAFVMKPITAKTSPPKRFPEQDLRT
jgi:hypothetical protein